MSYLTPTMSSITWARTSSLSWELASCPKSFRSVQVYKTIPAPDPRIIALHAACARIAHMSGAAEYLKETIEISVLTEPKATRELTRALRRLKLVSTAA